jgi:hypothetical protein
MVKMGEFVIIADSVENMVNFYTEKLFFDLTDIFVDSDNGVRFLKFARIKKGKCLIVIRKPRVEELVEFSFIKRCSGRSTGFLIELSEKEFNSFLNRYKRKKISLVFEEGEPSFFIKDPSGIKIVFAKRIEKVLKNYRQVFNVDHYKEGDEQLKKDCFSIVASDLKNFGISRRVAKKFFNKHVAI